MKPPVCVIGSSNWDMSMQLPRLPAARETISGGTCSFCLGGKGANQAVAAARAGAEVSFISCIGADSTAQEVLRELERNKISSEGLITSELSETGKAMIFVDRHGENCIGVADGANADLSPASLLKHEQLISQADVVLLQMEIPVDTVKAAAANAFEKRKTVILNPAPATFFDRKLLAQVSIFTPNQIEMEQICGSSLSDEISMRNAALALLDKGPEAVIITLGETGVYLVSALEQKLLPAFRVSVKDTTAAGDVFNGALAFAIAAEMKLHTAVEFAMAAAALSVQSVGAIPSIPEHREIENLLAAQNKRH